MHDKTTSGQIDGVRISLDDVLPEGIDAYIDARFDPTIDSIEDVLARMRPELEQRLKAVLMMIDSAAED